MSSPDYYDRGRDTARGFRYGKHRPPRRNFGVLILALVTLVGVVIIGRAVLSGGDERPSPSPVAKGTGSGTGQSGTGVTPSPKTSRSPKARTDGSTGENGPGGDSSTITPEIQKLIDGGRPIFCGGGNEPLVALTFDDGPGPYTPYALDTLKKAHAKATFFVVAKVLYSPQQEKLAAQEAKYAAVGDHSWTHIGLAGASQATLDHEVLGARKRIERAIREDVFMFRPPLGSRDSALENFIADNDMLMIVWSLDTLDATAGTKAEDILQHIKKGLSAGDIILMHENRGTTRSDIPQILQMVKDAGLTPVTVPELLTQDPPSNKQLKKGILGCN